MASRVPFLICVLVLIAGSSLAAGTNNAAVLARSQPLAWIRTSADKTHFICDGNDHRFVPWGFNYDHDDAGRFLEYYWADDWTKVADDFQEMKSLGANVVRIHLQLCRFMKSPEQPDETNLARLGMLVRLAEENGLYLDVTGLGCYYKDEVPAWYDAMDECGRWKVQTRFWSAVAGVGKDSPAVFCYDLMNEPVPSGDRKGDWLPGQPAGGSYFMQRLTTDMRGRTEKEVAKAWMAEMSAAVRAVDQRHMITVGLACWEEPFGPGARSAFCDPDVSAALDFLCVHYYPRTGKLDEDLAILKHYDLGKPLVIEEIFPLQADVETTEAFIRRSRMEADGWISFYWGKTPEEYDQEPGIQAALTGNWLRHFNALRGEIPRGFGLAAGTNNAVVKDSSSGNAVKDIAEAKVDPVVYDSLVGKYDFGRKARLTVTRDGNHLFAQFAGRNCEIFPESETEYFWKVLDAQVTFVKDGRGKVIKAVYHQGGKTMVGRKITSLERFWLSYYGRWFGAAALFYASYIGLSVSIRDRVPFQIMREFFHSLPRNFAGCFKGRNIAWLLSATVLCYSVDQPGHGASPRTYTFMEDAHTLEAVAREVGPVDVFAGHSMGGFTGGEAVQEGGMRPGLFIAIGSMPVLGDHAPPLLLLAGRFEEALPPALLKTRTDARLVISPWSDHFLEGFDPVLVNAAVEAACAAVHKTPPAPPTAWRWRLIGAVLATLAAGILASCLMDLFPQLARFRGMFIGVFITAAFMLTIGGRWLEATPHLRLQVIALPVILLLAIIAGKLRIPRRSIVALCVVVTAIAVCWFKASMSRAALILMASTLVLTPALIAGVVIGWFAARRGSRLQGDIAMAIFLGCAPFQCLELPRTAPQVTIPHSAIKLDAKILDACVGQYEFPPDNGFWLEWKLTFRRQGNQLVEQFTVKNNNRAAVEIYPESETNFFVKGKNPHELTFVKNSNGDATNVIVRYREGFVREGKKLKNE